MMTPLEARAAWQAGLTMYLEDPDVREIRVTAEGLCFLITQTGKVEGAHIDLQALEMFLILMARRIDNTFTAKEPCLAMGEPSLGFRIEATRPPIAPGIDMVLRKHPAVAFPLDAFAAAGILTAAQYATLTGLLDARLTLVIAGAMGSAKTSILNGCLAYLAPSRESFLVIEDTAEAVCPAPDTKYKRTSPTLGITLLDLCRHMLRSSADTVVVGEVRGGEVLIALKAFQTGVRGLMTIHAKAPEKVLPMIEQRVLEVSTDRQSSLIADAIGAVVFMEKTATLFRCAGILQVDGWSAEQGYAYTKLDT